MTVRSVLDKFPWNCLLYVDEQTFVPIPIASITQTQMEKQVDVMVANNETVTIYAV